MSGTQWWDGATQPLTQYPPPQARPTRTGAWPRATDYTQAIQDPGRVFSDPLLRSSRVETTMLGLPAAATGQNAIVFKVLAQGQPHAVRCFTPTQGEPNGDTYRRLAAMQLPAEMVPARWIENGIRVKQQDWPVLAMPWVAGDTLNIWLGGNAHDRGRVLEVRDALRAAYRKLRALNIVHGDLHHGNIIVTPRGEVRLVDFDGVCIFGASGDAPLTPRPTEVGHPNYQHPQRIRHGSWHRYTDTFAALVIDVSLSVIAAQPSRYADTGDSLLFTRDDLEKPESSSAFQAARVALASSPDDLRLVNVLQAWCARQERADIDLAAIVAGRDLPPSGSYTVAHDGGHRKSDRVASNWSATTKAPPPASPSAGSRPASPNNTVAPASNSTADDDGVIGFFVVIGLAFALVGLIVYGLSTSSPSAGPARPPAQPAAPAPAPARPTPVPTPSPPPPSQPTISCTYPASRGAISQGSRGAEVRLLQSRLGVTADGQFGPRTDRAVRDFQRSQSLPVNGTVSTWEWAMLGLTCPPSSSEVARYFADAGVWPVGACFRTTASGGVERVNCSERHTGVVSMNLRGSRTDLCPSYFWNDLGGHYSRWLTGKLPTHFECLAPSLTAQPS